MKATADVTVEIRQLELESKILSAQFTISGVSEAIPKASSSDLVNVVVRLGSMLSVSDLTTNNFLYAERIEKKNGPVGRRDIVVKCKSPQTVGSFIAAKKNYRSFTANILYPQLEKVPVNISRRYPSVLYKLRQSIVKKYRAIGKKNV